MERLLGLTGVDALEDAQAPAHACRSPLSGGSACGTQAATHRRKINIGRALCDTFIKDREGFR